MTTINLKVPSSWGELTQEQLRQVYLLMVRHGSDPAAWIKVAANAVYRWNGIKIVSPYGRNFLIRVDTREYVMATTEYSDVCRSLAWLREIPSEPVRLEHIDGYLAMPADPTYDLTFEQWLSVENLYQGYHYTQDNDLLRQIAGVLYRREDITITPSEEISVFYWWSSVKRMVSAMFPSFFRPAPVGSSDTPDFDTVRRSVDSQIRALTKGDISKEEKIMAMPAIRALTELDAQAREYEEMNRKYPSK